MMFELSECLCGGREVGVYYIRDITDWRFLHSVVSLQLVHEQSWSPIHEA